MTVISDSALLARTRNGDMSAYDELYRRHVDDATRVARIVMSNNDEAQDLVSEAFIRVLRRVQDGGGPEDDLAPYLRTVVRRLAIDHYRSAQRSGSADPSTFDVMPCADDPIAKATDRQLVRRAFEALPPRWQEVLWRTEIEGRSPAWLAERLGTSANAAAALAYRAREGLRQAYLSMNITIEDRPECKPFARKIPAQVRGTLSAREDGPLLDHLGECAHCRERRDELHILVSDLPAALWPALLLPVAVPSVLAGVGAGAGAGTAGAGGGVLAWLSPSNWGQNIGRTVGVSTTVVVAAAIAAAMLLASYTPESPPVAAPPPPLEQQPADPEPPEEEPPPDDSTVEPPQYVPVADPPGDPEPPDGEAPGFAAHPRDVTVRAGEPVTLSIVATGSPAPDLQWQMRDRGAGTWTDTPGEDGPELELADPPPAFDGREYRVVATNESGSATSDVAVLTVHYRPVVVTQPHDIDVVFGDEVVLRAAAEANPGVESARWQVRGADGWSDVPGSAASGATAELVLEDVDFGDDATYRAVFTNEIGTAITSQATVTVAVAGTLRAEVPRAGGPDESAVRCVQPSGERVRLSTCTASTWRLSADGALHWADGTCLDMRDVGGISRQATTAPCTGAVSQRWTIDPAKARPQRLENREGVCLAAHGWTRTSVLATQPCDSSSGRFVFAPDDS